MTSHALRITIGALVVVVGLLVIGAVSWISLASEGPEQPIEFMHTVHVEQNDIDCVFCHRNVETGAEATIPAIEQCMMCHSVINGDNRGAEGEGESGIRRVTNPLHIAEIAKLQAHWENREPIDWVRVHVMPDHVRFVHAAHIKAGFDCATCHGDVGSMERVKQVRSLNMGDCVACHRENNAPTDCTICHR